MQLLAHLRHILREDLIPLGHADPARNDDPLLVSRRPKPVPHDRNDS